nr:hypothetical protein Iba_chr13aCG8350 [Ipomoea batatas]
MEPQTPCRKLKLFASSMGLASAVPPLGNANYAACHSNSRRHRRQQTNQRRSLVTSLMPAGGEVAATNAWIWRRLKKGNLLCLHRLCPPTILNHARPILVSRKQTSMANQKTNIDSSEEWRDAVIPAQGQRLSSILCSSLNRRSTRLDFSENSEKLSVWGGHMLFLLDIVRECMIIGKMQKCMSTDLATIICINLSRIEKKLFKQLFNKFRNSWKSKVIHRIMLIGTSTSNSWRFCRQ